MANKIIKGNELMLFDGEGKSYAYATNHTLTLNTETSDTSSKDHGIWGAIEVTKFTWEITSENLYTEEDFDKIFDKWVAGEKVTCRFGIKKELDNTKTVVDGDYPNWSNGTTFYEGDAFITSLSANANNGENATYSLTLSGIGKFVKKTGSI